MPFDDLRWPRDMQRATTSDLADAFGVDAEPQTGLSRWPACQTRQDFLLRRLRLQPLGELNHAIVVARLTTRAGAALPWRW